MIRVALCDDDPVMREKMASLWKEAASEFQVMAELAAFPSGEALLSSPVDFDLLFLDVEMEGMNGIETARVLRRRGKNADDSAAGG